MKIRNCSTGIAKYIYAHMDPIKIFKIYTSG